MAEAETPPPIRPGPTAKERKYDRQLRLWAATGQSALEDSHILLINSGTGVTGVEALKNLVLPGIGKYTIVDGARVVEADLGVNFFLEEEDLGKSRAECTNARLQELNPDVSGHAIAESAESFLARPNALAPYTFILVVLPLHPDLQKLIVDHCTNKAIPAFYLHTIGFYSQSFAHLPAAFPIVDTHPDPASTTDLRLLEPWPELQAVVQEKTANLDAMDAEEHGHVPYLLLLLYYLDKWKSTHDGKLPTAYKEKTAFREMVRNAARTDGPDGFEENYEEAVNAVLKTLTPHAASSAVREVFNAPECTNPSADSPTFWVIAHAVSSFYAKSNALPLSGTLPDMKAKSADYIHLQNTYKAKARADVAAVADAVRALERALHRAPPIHIDEIAAFCKSAASIKLLRGRPPPLMPHRFGPRAAPAAAALADPDSPMPLLLAFLAVQHASATPAPPLFPEHGPADDAALTDRLCGIAGDTAAALLADAGATLNDDEAAALRARVRGVLAEMVRARGAELHNVAAVAGGIVAQEAIKVVTRQYVPVDNCCLYDGVRSTTGVLRL